MVTIINYKVRQNLEGKDFYLLVLQGGVEMLQSTKTGKMFATAKQATITCTFDEPTCKSLIGTKFPGKIIREDVPEYEYKVPNSDDVIILNHTYAYVNENETVEENVFGD